MASASASAFALISFALRSASLVICASSRSILPIHFAFSPSPSERNACAIWLRSLIIRS